MRLNAMESSLGHQCTTPTCAQQHCIAVKFAAGYREPGQWIEWIVFNQADQSAGPNNPPHLAQETDPPRRQHVMQHTDRDRKIKGRTIVGKGFTHIGFVLDPGISDPGLSDAGRRDVGATQPTEHTLYEWMKFADAAADIKHVGLRYAR